MMKANFGCTHTTTYFPPWSLKQTFYIYIQTVYHSRSTVCYCFDATRQTHAPLGCRPFSRPSDRHHLHLLCRRLCAEPRGGLGSVPGLRSLQVVQHADGLRLPLHEQQGRSSSGAAARRVRPPGETLRGFTLRKLDPDWVNL